MPLVYAGQRVTAALLSAGYSAGDPSTVTVTAATMTALTRLWTVPGNDAQAGTAYRVTTGGYGTWGSTQQALTFAAALSGHTVGVLPTIAAGAFAASAGFRWAAAVTVMCTQSGTAGTWTAALLGTASVSGASLDPGTAATNTVPFADSPVSQLTLDTTSPQTVALEAMWASVAGAPAITSEFSLFEKLGG